MTVYEIDKNGVIEFRRKEPTIDEMLAYVKEQLNKGRQLNHIVFVWRPIRVK